MTVPLTSLHEMLARHVPEDDKERDDLARMRTLARELERPLSRAQARAHFTASAVVVDPAGDRVVMLHHGKLHRWLQPGGHVEEADAGDLEVAALREAREETGCRVRLHSRAPRPLDVDIQYIPPRKNEPEHLHLDVRFLMVAEDPESLAHDPNESADVQWLPWDEALARSDQAALRRMLEKARAAMRAG